MTAKNLINESFTVHLREDNKMSALPQLHPKFGISIHKFSKVANVYSLSIWLPLFSPSTVF